MCFSLPTPDDPFNDQHDKNDFQTTKAKKRKPLQEDRNASLSKKGTKSENNTKEDRPKLMPEKSITYTDNEGKKSAANSGRTEIQLNGKNFANGHKEQASENMDCPSKYLILCLNAIENALRHDDTYKFEQEKPLFVNSWGIEFWKCYSSGKDILETSGSSSTIEQIAWMVSTAADTIARKEKEGYSFTSPFLLFLVPSQAKAVKVCMLLSS